MRAWSSRLLKMRSIGRALACEEDGSYILETALVMPAFLTTVFLFFTCGIGLFVYGNITYAASSAVRYASVRSNSSMAPCTSTLIQTTALADILTAGGGVVTIAPNWSSGNIIGSTVTVTITVVYPLYIPFLSADTWTLSSTATGMVIN